MTIKTKINTGLILMTCCATVLLGCGNLSLKKQVRNYRGDGKIKYIKAPLLGIAGVRIDFPSFDLSKDFSATYRISGIPKGNFYYVCLKLVETIDMYKVEKYFPNEKWGYRVTQDRKVMVEQFDSLRNSRLTGDDHNLYFYMDTGIEGPSKYFNVEAPHREWMLTVFYKKGSKPASGKGFFHIRRGGYK